MKKNKCYQLIMIFGISILGISFGSHAQDGVDLIDDTKRDEPPKMSASEAKEAQKLGKLLDDMYAVCGRYPTTQEGLKALVSKPKTIKCDKWGIKINSVAKPYLASVPKGWKYVSKDGSAYTVEPAK